MTDEEKELYMKYCKYDKEPKEVIIDLVNLIQTQQEEIEQVLNDYQDLGKEKYELECELEKKDTLINTMQAEFERLEDLEDNTDMLKLQLQNKERECQKYHDGMMELIAKKNEKNLIIVEIAKAWKQDDIRGVHEIIQYFTNKVKKELENDN